MYFLSFLFFSYLQRNVNHFSNVFIYPFGLYDDYCAKDLFFRRPSTEFARLGIDHISILKIDTEGAEVPILKDLSEWPD